MAAPNESDGRPGPIPPRVRLVIALTEVNSRHLRGETRVAAAEIELERVLEDARQGQAGAELEARRAPLEQRLEAAREELRVIETEREWLEQQLVHFDDAPAGPEGAQ